MEVVDAQNCVAAADSTYILQPAGKHLSLSCSLSFTSISSFFALHPYSTPRFVFPSSHPSLLLSPFSALGTSNVVVTNARCHGDTASISLTSVGGVSHSSFHLFLSFLIPFLSFFHPFALSPPLVIFSLNDYQVEPYSFAWSSENNTITRVRLQHIPSSFILFILLFVYISFHIFSFLFLSYLIHQLLIY